MSNIFNIKAIDPKVWKPLFDKREPNEHGKIHITKLEYILTEELSNLGEEVTQWLVEKYVDCVRYSKIDSMLDYEEMLQIVSDCFYLIFQKSSVLPL